MQIFKYGWKCRESYARSGIEATGNNDEILLNVKWKTYRGRIRS